MRPKSVGDAVRVRLTAADGGVLSGSALAQGSVAKRPIGREDVELNAGQQYAYTGRRVDPELRVIVDGRKLEEGSDYELVRPDDATSPGSKTIDIVCPDTSNYTSAVTVRYEVAEPETPAAPPTVSDADGTTAVVAGNVTARAFAGNKRITEVRVTGSPKTIGKAAFKGCTRLASVTVAGKKLAKISADAFSGCVALRTVALSSVKLKSIHKTAFKGCKKVTLKVPKSQVKKAKRLIKRAKATKTLKAKRT